MDYGIDEYIRPEDLHEPILDQLLPLSFVISLRSGSLSLPSSDNE